jgi:hypothetical protein
MTASVEADAADGRLDGTRLGVELASLFPDVSPHTLGHRSPKQIGVAPHS